MKPSYNNKIQVEIKPQDYKISSTLIRHEKQGTSEAIDIVQPDNGVVKKNNPVFPNCQESYVALRLKSSL